MVELVHGDQPVVERLDAELVDGEAEGGMGADQHLVVAVKERARPTLTLPPFVRRRARCRGSTSAATVQSAQKPNWLSGSSCEARADGLLRHDDDRLLASPDCASLSSAMNISARLLPEAGGDLISRYCSPRFS